MRWDEPRDPDRRPTPRLLIAAASVAALGVLLVAGTALAPAAPAPAPTGTVAATEAGVDPTGRGGLPHSVPSTRPSPTTAPAPAPAPVAEVARVAATARTTRPPAAVPAPSPLIGRVGQPCDVAGARAVTAEGGPVVCEGGNGNGRPHWRKA